jgi:hypothetical protein
MSIAQPQARDGAELQVGDSVRYEKIFHAPGETPTIDGIIVGIYLTRHGIEYHVFNRTANFINLPLIEQDQIVTRINVDYRGMSGNYILGLHDAAHMSNVLS